MIRYWAEIRTPQSHDNQLLCFMLRPPSQVGENSKDFIGRNALLSAAI